MENFEKTEKKPKKKKESMPLSAIVVGIVVAFFGLKVVSGEATMIPTTTGTWFQAAIKNER